MLPTSFSTPLPTQSPRTSPTGIVPSSTPTDIVSAAPKSAEPGKNPDRLSAVPTCISTLTAEWLAPQDMVNLMQANQRYAHRVKQFYRKRLKAPDSHTLSAQQVYNRCASARLDRYIPTDRLGLGYLTACEIYYPLTEQIRTGGLTLKQAHALLSARRLQMGPTVLPQSLSKRQQEIVENCLFAEHFLSGRCNFDTMVRLADNVKNLFFSLTLRDLFRCGALNPVDLEKISAAGLELVHHPLLLTSVQRGQLSKAQLLGLTPAQLDSLLICHPLLTDRKLAIQSVLAMTAKQTEAVRKTLCAGAPVLGWSAACLRASPHPGQISLLRYLDPTVTDEHTFLARFKERLHAEGITRGTLINLQITINLARHLKSEDYLRVIQPYLTDVFGALVALACLDDKHVVIQQCCGIWAMVQMHCARAGVSSEPFRNMIIASLKKERQLTDQRHLEPDVLVALGRLFFALHLHEDEAFFTVWGGQWLAKGLPNLSSEVAFCYTHAFLCPYEKFALGTTLLDAVSVRLDHFRDFHF